VGIKSKGFHKQHKKIHNCILKIVLQNNQYNSNPNTFNMTKISAVAFSLAVVFQQAEAFAFIATRSLASPATVTFAQKPHRESAFGRDIDLAKANDMADHFGKYSLEEVEQMRRELHTDRLQHFVDERVGFRSDLNPDEEIGRILLEEDLNLQARLLKDINSGEGSIMGTPPSGMDGAMAIQHHQMHVDAEANKMFNNQIQAMTTLGTGVPEAIMLCLAMIVIMTMPHLIL